MNGDEIDNIKIITKFMDALKSAGFGDFPVGFNNITDYFSGSDKKVFRDFFLLTEGLGEFKLKAPKRIHLCGPAGRFSREAREQIEEEIWACYSVHPNDKNRFRVEFCLNGAKIISPFEQGQRKTKLGPAVARSLKKYKARLGTVWILQWLFRHKEVIPKAWQKIIMNGGRIFFPGAGIIPSRTHNSERREYPCLKKSFITHRIDYEYQSSTDDELNKGQDFFAVFPEVKNP